MDGRDVPSHDGQGNSGQSENAFDATNHRQNIFHIETKYLSPRRNTELIPVAVQISPRRPRKNPDRAGDRPHTDLFSNTP
jgi:hypothetical protein